MDAAIAEVEAEVVVSQEGMTSKRVASEGMVDGEGAVQGANVEKAPDADGVEAKVEVVPQGEEIH